MAKLGWGDWYTDTKGIRTKYFPVHKGQAEVLQSRASITAAIAGSGGGKSVIIPLIIANLITERPNAEILLTGPTVATLINVVLTHMTKAYSGTELEGKFVAGDNPIYTTGTGNKIYFRSAYNPQSMQGIHADLCIIDEAGLCNAETFEIAQQRVADKGGRVVITSTPYDFGWLYHQVWQRWKSGDPDYHCVSFASDLNPTYNLESLERLRRTLPDWKFRQKYLGEFTRPAGSIYPDMPDCLIEASGLPRIKVEQFLGGTDWGFNDPSVALVGFCHLGTLYIVYEKYITQKTVAEFAADLPKQNVIYRCDSSSPGSIKEMRKMGFNAHKCKKYAGSVNDNIAAVTAAIRSGKLKIVRGATPNLIREAELYAREPDPEQEGVYTDKPCGKNDHTMDALAYLVQLCNKRHLLDVGKTQAA